MTVASRVLVTPSRTRTLLLGVGGGLVGHATGLPAGALVGSLLATGALGLATDVAQPLPSWLRPASRALIGTVIGSLVTVELLRTLGLTAVWALGLSAGMIGVGIAAATVLQRGGIIDRPTAMLACAPGGLAEMTALADEVGARADLVLGVHLLRKFAALVVALLTITAIVLR